MKKIFYLITLLTSAMCFSSCGSHKSTMKQETSIESGSTHQRKDTVSFSEQVKKTEHEDVRETIEETKTVYDTSKPIDPTTGKHPVSSETKKTTKRESNKQKQEDKNTSLNQSTVVNDNQKVVVQDKKEEDKQKEETTVPRQISGIVWALVALIGVGIIGIVVYRRRNKKGIQTKLMFDKTK